MPTTLHADSRVVTKGQIEIGEEYTNTRWKSRFDNQEGYIANSNNEQHESNIAPFVELRQRLGRFQLSVGLRYEHVESEYFVSGVRYANVWDASSCRQVCVTNMWSQSTS